VEQDTLALPGGLLRAGLVHRGYCSGASPGADHPTTAHPDRRRDRGRSPLGGRSRRQPRGVLAGDQSLLGQREGRTSATVIDWLTEHTPEFRAGIDFVAIDPAAVYAAAIRT